MWLASAVLLVGVVAAFLVGPLFRGQPGLQAALWVGLGVGGIVFVLSTLMLLAPWPRPPTQPSGDRQATAGDRSAAVQSMSCPVCGAGMDRGVATVQGRPGFLYRLIHHHTAAAVVTHVWFVPMSEADEVAAEKDWRAISRKLRADGVRVCDGLMVYRAFRCSACTTFAIAPEPAPPPAPGDDCLHREPAQKVRS